MSSVSTNAAGAPLTTLFPGINFVRLPVFSYNDPSYYQTFISQLTAMGIVVEIEDHTNSDGSDIGGNTGVVYSGNQLTAELNWYSAVASAYANNPYVWFGTDNEPPENPSTAALSTWQQQTYNAIRSAGNNNPVFIETYGVQNNGYTPSVYAAMTNVVWDMHYYGWAANDSTDLATVESDLTSFVSQVQTITSADGVMPVFIGEYGITTSATSVDPNGNQIITAVQSSGLGSSAWAWNEAAANDLTSRATVI